MVEIVEESSIARPRAAVRDALADSGGSSRWAPNVDHSCLASEQRAGGGSVRRIQGGRPAFVSIDAGHRPPRQLVARAMGRVLAKSSREMLAGSKSHLEEIAS